MSRLASDVVEDALLSEEGCERLSENLNSLRVKLKLFKDGAGNNELGGSSSQTQYMKGPKRVRMIRNQRLQQGSNGDVVAIRRVEEGALMLHRLGIRVCFFVNQDSTRLGMRGLWRGSLEKMSIKKGLRVEILGVFRQLDEELVMFAFSYKKGKMEDFKAKKVEEMVMIDEEWLGWLLECLQ
ncbi:hypothetical protein L3X38_025484 [Prunus dulcis]|uniref:Uncharacterized protein n=1 Tax=Prunus dulcis TaxID=3755 RepID=A0AAD4W2K7_PRUDU|nr:hypothetical protein L3X38_025484 [Prunus dulcis]